MWASRAKYTLKASAFVNQASRPNHRGAEPLHKAVQDDRGAEYAPRVGRIEVGELERGEEKELDCCGPSAPVLVTSHRFGGRAELLGDPRDTVRERLPRVERRPAFPSTTTPPPA